MGFVVGIFLNFLVVFGSPLYHIYAFGMSIVRVLLSIGYHTVVYRLLYGGIILGACISAHP